MSSAVIIPPCTKCKIHYTILHSDYVIANSVSSRRNVQKSPAFSYSKRRFVGTIPPVIHIEFHYGNSTIGYAELNGNENKPYVLY